MTTLDLDAVTRAAATDAEARDRDGGFPRHAFDALHALGATDTARIESDDPRPLLALLVAAGRGDLSVGRILEGHLNALWLVRAYGHADQWAATRARARDGALFGVWNTDLPHDPLGLDGDTLSGGKGFATGVDGLDAALVTVETPRGRQMILAPLSDATVDRDWWRPMGMRASGSHRVDFTGVGVGPGDLIGEPGDYVREPAFSAGAMRFLAVHLGGATAVLDVAVEHLNRTGRTGDPHQRSRIGRMACALQSGHGWLDRCARDWTAAQRDPAHGPTAVATVNGARHAIETAALEGLELAERGIGAAGMIAPHRFERLSRDLRTYLRQPNPDGALDAFGVRVLDGGWRPEGGAG